MLERTDNVRPLRDRVLVKELPWPGKTGGGLHLPDQAKKRDELWRAVVVAVGPGKPAPELLRRALKLLDEAGGQPPDPEWYDQRGELEADVRAGISVGFGADVKVGDVVLVSKYVHTKVSIGGEEHCVIAATDILGVVTDGSEQLREALLHALGRLPQAAE
jgi:chaperonin GroES